MDRDVVGRGKQRMEEAELEMLLNEIPHVTSAQENVREQYHFLQRNGGFTLPGTLAPPPPPPPPPYPPLPPSSFDGSLASTSDAGFVGRTTTTTTSSNLWTPYPTFFPPSLSEPGSSSMGARISGVVSTIRDNQRMIEELYLVNRMRGLGLGSDVFLPNVMPRSGLLDDSHNNLPYVNGNIIPNGEFVPQRYYHPGASSSRPVPTNTMVASASSSSHPLPSAFYGNLHLPGQSSSSLARRRFQEEQIIAATSLGADCRTTLPPFDDSYIIPAGNDLRLVSSRNGGGYMRRERFNNTNNFDELQYPPPRPSSSMYRTFKYNSLADIRGCIYYVATDQLGCRFLQQKLEERKPDEVEMIFGELIGHASQLMRNPFANYLMQKLFEVCNADQILTIVLAITEHPYQLVEICLDGHGTRSIQRLLETLQTPEQIEIITSNLQPGFLLLIENLNGHHVIQRCLQCLDPVNTTFIFAAAARHCVRLATDQHGCCVLQRCIIRSKGDYQLNLIMQVAANGLALAQDRYGNYAVQFVMDMENPVANGRMMSQFKGNYVELSRNKFGSNVVEKCLKLWEDTRKIIIQELLATPHFDMLLQHQYANYVIQRALSFKGPMRDELINAIQPHAPVLRASPYCKKIFSKPCFRKLAEM